MKKSNDTIEENWVLRIWSGWLRYLRNGRNWWGLKGERSLRNLENTKTRSMRSLRNCAERVGSIAHLPLEEIPHHLPKTIWTVKETVSQILPILWGEKRTNKKTTTSTTIILFEISKEVNGWSQCWAAVPWWSAENGIPPWKSSHGSKWTLQITTAKEQQRSEKN